MYNSLAEIEADAMILELGRRGYNIDALLEGDKVHSDNFDDVNTFGHLGSLVAKNALESPLSHAIKYWRTKESIDPSTVE